MHETIMADAFFKLTEATRAWTEADLVLWLDKFRNYGEGFDHTVFVINNLDQCTNGSMKAFLRSFSYLSQISEERWKMVIASDRVNALSGELVNCSHVTLDLSSDDIADSFGDEREDNKQHVMSSRPDLYLHEDLVTDELAGLTETDPVIRHIILEQAIARDDWPEKFKIGEIYESFKAPTASGWDDTRLASLLEQIISKIPEQETCRRVLTWMLFAVRPLTVFELADVFQPDEFTAYQDTSDKIVAWFAGVLERDQNEVRFTHTRVRRVMMGHEAYDNGTETSERPTRIWDDIKETAHYDIASFCLEFLARPSSREFTENTYFASDPDSYVVKDTKHTFAGRYRLCGYALQAWTHHLVHCSSNEQSKLYASLKTQPGLEEICARGYWALSNPFIRNSACPATLFPVFAGLGILDVVRPRDKEDAYLGLLEAAARGQVDTVKRLLEPESFGFTFDEPELLCTLVAVGSSGKEELLLNLIDAIVSTHEGAPDTVAWPPAIIYRAALLGLDRAIDRLCQLGCSPDAKLPWRDLVHVSPLGFAARHVDASLPAVRALIKHKADVEFSPNNGKTPLMFAAIEGNHHIAKTLIDQGKAKLEVKDRYGKTALYYASIFGQYKVVEALLDAGADPNMGFPRSEKIDDCWGPLKGASDDGFLETVRILLDHNADPNLGGSANISPPLQQAAFKNHVEVCRMLLERGADPNHQGVVPPILEQVMLSSGPAHDEQAIVELEKAQIELFKLLLENGANPDAKNYDGRPVIAIAASLTSNSDVFCQLLVDHGADVNAVDSDNDSPLGYACNRGNRKAAEILISKGADINHKGRDYLPLYLAVLDVDFARMLLDKGADPDKAGYQGFTPLMCAAMYRQTAALELLLEHKATVDLQHHFDGLETWEGHTAMSFAVIFGSDEDVRLLAETGADLQHRIADGDSLLHLAVKTDQLPVLLEYLPRLDLDQTDALGHTILHKYKTNMRDFKRFIHAGASLEKQDPDGDTPLTYAAYSNNHDKVKLLLRHKVDVNLASHKWGAPLHQAVQKQHLTMVKLLVENKADVNLVVDGVGTPLMVACEFQMWSVATDMDDEASNYETGIVRYLLENGAKVNLEGGSYVHPICEAVLRSPCSVIRLLLDNGANVQVADTMGRMPIHWAALYGGDRFPMILDAGGDIKATDNFGRTALHWAAQAGRHEVVKRILELWGDDETSTVDVPDKMGWTPLCWAARGLEQWSEQTSGRQNHVEVVRVLLERGANRLHETQTAASDEGGRKWTPLSIANHSGGAAPRILDMLQNDLGESPKDSGQATEQVQERAWRWDDDETCHYCQYVSFRQGCCLSEQ